MTVRALIVDEIFDANSLDIAVIELAARVCPVTVVGDPWQALYGFRGARPDEVPGLLARTGMVRLPLSVSFRWRTEEQRQLADRLRAGEGVTLPSGPEDDVDVVLACQWKQLWETGAHVLPLAYGSAKGNTPEAAATLLLNQLTRTVLGENATYLSDALATLGITDPDAPRRLEPALQDVIEDSHVRRQGRLEHRLPEPRRCHQVREQTRVPSGSLEVHRAAGCPQEQALILRPAHSRHDGAPSQRQGMEPRRSKALRGGARNPGCRAACRQ